MHIFGSPAPERGTGSSFLDALVTGLDPLRVLLDGDVSPLPFTPDSLIDASVLEVGDRVRCELAQRRVIVHGRADGVAPPPPRAPVEYPWSSGSSVAAGASSEITVTLPRVCAIERVVTSRAMRVRLYDRAAKSTADASRASGVLPSGDHGVLVEVDGGTAAEDVTVNPRTVITNRDGSTSYKVRLQNLSASSAVLTGSFWIVL